MVTLLPVSPVSVIIFFFTIVNKLLIILYIVNMRFSFKPAVITFPKNAEEVSTVIQISQKCSYSVVARSGGVRP